MVLGFKLIFSMGPSLGAIWVCLFLSLAPVLGSLEQGVTRHFLFSILRHPHVCSGGGGGWWPGDWNRKKCSSQANNALPPGTRPQPPELRGAGAAGADRGLGDAAGGGELPRGARARARARAGGRLKRAGCGLKPMGSHSGVGAPPILEPILMGIDPWPAERNNLWVGSK